jgi:hypothetical protein
VSKAHTWWGLRKPQVIASKTKSVVVFRYRNYIQGLTGSELKVQIYDFPNRYVNLC